MKADKTTERLLLGLVLVLIAGCGSETSIPPLSQNAVILAFGDSLTAGYGAPRDRSYPAHLERLLNRRVINAGVSGEVSREGMMRLAQLLDEHRPQLLILCHGGNDLLRNLPETELEANLLAMINMAWSRAIPVVMLGVPDRGLFLSSADVYESVAEAAQVVYIPEAVSDVLSQRALKSDTVHPNGEGYARIADAVYRELQERGAI